MTNFISEHANEILASLQEAEKVTGYTTSCNFYNISSPCLHISTWCDRNGIQAYYYMSESMVMDWLNADNTTDYIVNKLYEMMKQEELRRIGVLNKIGGM